MLYDVQKGREIHHIPHFKEFNDWKEKLTEQQIESIKDEIRSKIEGTEIQTSSWMPGSDWSNTPYQAIYEDACQSNEITSGLCFGLFVWETFMEGENYWGFGKYEKDGIEIKGITYFRVTPVK